MEAKRSCQALLDKIVDLLESYRGRDKTIRLLNYMSYLIGGSLERLRGKGNDMKMASIAQELSNLRVMLRLFDDLAMLKFTISYGTGKKEADPICSKLQLIQNCSDQLYYPLEHIAWARDVGILSGKSDKFWGLGCCLWVVSLLMGILNAVIKLYILHKKEKAAKELDPECEHLSRCNGSESVDEKERVSPSLTEITKIRKQLLIGLCANLADLVNGVHWLPGRVLWSSKLPNELVGVFGTISSICYLYNAINS